MKPRHEAPEGADGDGLDRRHTRAEEDAEAGRPPASYLPAAAQPRVVRQTIGRRGAEAAARQAGNQRTAWAQRPVVKRGPKRWRSRRARAQGGAGGGCGPGGRAAPTAPRSAATTPAAQSPPARPPAPPKHARVTERAARRCPVSSAHGPHGGEERAVGGGGGGVVGGGDAAEGGDGGVEVVLQRRGVRGGRDLQRERGGGGGG